MRTEPLKPRIRRACAAMREFHLSKRLNGDSCITDEEQMEVHNELEKLVGIMEASRYSCAVTDLYNAEVRLLNIRPNRKRSLKS